MDGHRFDAVTRVLVGGLPRRDALKALAGVALAGIATRAAIYDAKACLGDGDGPCSKRSECCAGYACIFASCGPCIQHNHRCKSSEECCAGLICNDHNNCTKGEGGSRCEGSGCKKKRGKRHRA
jgi:hypothetical protein